MESGFFFEISHSLIFMFRRGSSFLLCREKNRGRGEILMSFQKERLKVDPDLRKTMPGNKSSKQIIEELRAMNLGKSKGLKEFPKYEPEK